MIPFMKVERGNNIDNYVVHQVVWNPLIHCTDLSLSTFAILRNHIDHLAVTSSQMPSKDEWDKDENQRIREFQGLEGTSRGH